MPMDPADAREIGKLARRLAAVEKRQKKGNRTAAGRFRSVEGGAQSTYDDDGVLRNVSGRQEDGSYTSVDVNAPPPPVPAAPTLTARSGLLVVDYDGTTADGTPWPADARYVEVHVSTTSGAPATDATQVTELSVRRGGSVPVALDAVTQYVTLVAVNTSGTESEPSAEVSGKPLEPSTGSGGVKTYRAASEPVGLDADDDGALWYDTDNGNLVSRWDGDTLAWVAMPTGAGGLDDQAVTAPKLDLGAVQAQAIADGAVTADAIAQAAVLADAIADGAVAEGKIAAGAVTATAIAAGAIEAGHIAADAVTATAIAAGAITADMIGAGTLDAAVAMVGNLTVRDGGDIRVAGGGDIVVDDSGRIAIIDGGSIAAEYPAAFNAPGVASTFMGDVFDEGDGHYLGTGLIAQRKDGNNILNVRSDQTGDDYLIRIDDKTGGNIFRYVDSENYLQLGYNELPSTGLYGREIVIGSTGTKRTDNSYLLGYDVQIGSTDTNTTGVYCNYLLTVSADWLELYGRLRLYGLPQKSSGSANLQLVVSGSGSPNIYYVTSSRRFKKDIRDAGLDASSVLALQPRTWFDNNPPADPDDPDLWPEQRGLGYIAEEVHDLGLTELVEYDEHGDPLSVRYDRFSTAVLTLCQAQQAQIDRLMAHAGID